MVMVPQRTKLRSGRQLFQHCSMPLLVVMNTLLLVYLVLRTQGGERAGSVTHGPSMLRMSRGSATRDENPDEVIAGLRNQIASLMKLRIEYGELYCKQHGIGPTGGFCVKSVEEEVGYNHYWDKPACSRMAEIFRDSTVLDLGCGLGWYGRCLEEAKKGITWTGMDGSEGIEKATSGFVKFADLTIPQYLEHKYDWVMSLEVGEHIPYEFEDVFLTNLVRHAKKGVLLSWAVEGQGGHHHVNNHNNDYVIDKMRAKGFEYDRAASESVRTVAELPWFQSTTMIFRRK